MRHPIEKSPRDGTAIILEDDASGTYDVAHWSAEAGEWVGENGEPSKITPTHWYPKPSDQFLQALREQCAVGIPDLDVHEDDRPPRRFAVLSSTAALMTVLLMAVGLMVLYFQVDAPETLLSSQGSHKTAADHARFKAGAQVKQAVEAPLREARQSFKMGQRTEVLANELAEDQRAKDWLNRQLQAEAASSAQLLGQESQNGSAARQELTASTVQHRQALDEEPARSAALASELAAAQGAIETQDETAQLKQVEAAKSAQSLEQEQQRIAILAQEAAASRQELTTSTAQHPQALDEERARGAALASELATAQREIEMQASQLRKASEEAAELNQAEAAKRAQLIEQERQRMAVLAQEAAAARQELTTSTAQHRQALDEERARGAALASELATAQREIESQAAQLRKVSDERAQLKQAAESAMAQLRQSLQQERARTEAMARDIESARRTVGARATPEPAANSPISKAAQAAEVAAMAPPAVAEAQGSPEAPRLIARAGALLSQGDIGAARTMLERAAETGSAKANFMLAETYDPGILSAWGTYGTRGEVTKARELYAKAHAAGIQEAGNRFNALRQ
jgi:hypothetical protein